MAIRSELCKHTAALIFALRLLMPSRSLIHWPSRQCPDVRLTLGNPWPQRSLLANTARISSSTSLENTRAAVFRHKEQVSMKRKYAGVAQGDSSLSAVV